MEAQKATEVYEKDNHDKAVGGFRRFLLSFAPQQTENARRRVLRCAHGIAFGAAAYLLAGTPLLFAVNPLACALLCAAEEGAGWIFAGLLLGYGKNPTTFPVYAWAAGISLLSRFLYHAYTQYRALPQKARGERRTAHLRQMTSAFHRICIRGRQKKEEDTTNACEDKASQPRNTSLFFFSPFSDPVRLRVLVATVCALLPGFVLPIKNGFAFYDLYGALLTIFLCPLATLFFAYGLQQNAQDLGKAEKALRLLGQLGLFLALCRCGGTLRVLGLVLVYVLVTIASLYCVGRYGLFGGALVGGLGALVSTPSLVPVYLLLVTVYALLSPMVNHLGLLPATLSALTYTLLVNGSAAFWGIFPSFCVGVLLFSAYQQFEEVKAVKGGATKDAAIHQDEVMRAYLAEQNRNLTLTGRLTTAASACGGLAEVFRQVEENLRKANTSTGKATVLSPMPDALPHRQGCEEMYNVRGELLADGYDAIGRLFRDILLDNNESNDYRVLAQTSLAVAAYLDKEKIPYSHVSVFGDTHCHVQITGLTAEKLTVSEEVFRLALQEICGVLFDKPRYDDAEEGTVHWLAKPPFQVTFLHRSQGAKESSSPQSKRTTCGDSLRLFEGPGGMFYALLCDGMGRGRTASLISGLCTVFLERTLRMGASVDTALRMLNQYLRARTAVPEEECFSTVDLLAIDLFQGQARFIKSGAAPTFVIREGKIYRLAARSVPIGILHLIDAQVIPFTLQPGDEIWMLSDGVYDPAEVCSDVSEDVGKAAVSEEEWLLRYLTDEAKKPDIRSADEGREFIGRLFCMARERGSDDDMSAIYIKIGKGEQKEDV